MRIRRPGGLRTFDVCLAVLFGAFGGYYIWKPSFEEHFRSKTNLTPETNLQKAKAKAVNLAMFGIATFGMSSIMGAILLVKWVFGPSLKRKKLDKSAHYAESLFQMQAERKESAAQEDTVLETY